MSVTYRFDGPVLRFEVTDDSDWNEIRGALEAAMSAPDFEGGRTLLFVEARRSSYEPAEDVLRDIGRWLADSITRFGHPILVVTRDELQYGLTRMAVAFAGTDAQAIELFRSAEKAEDRLRELSA